MHLTVSWLALIAVVIAACAACAGGHSAGGGRVSPTAAAPATAGSQPSLPVVDTDCGSAPPTDRPRDIALACADGTLRLTDLRWDAYGERSASGVGAMHANSCRPTCAAGGYRDYPVDVTLGRVVPAVKAGGRASFTEVDVTYAGAGPDGRHRVSYPIQ